MTGNFIYPSNTSQIRNPEGFWINTQPFREDAIHYTKYGYYCPEPFRSPGWFEFWRERSRRCVEGYTVGGVRITGNHYFYLNFCQIMVAKKIKAGVAKKVLTFPDFWDGDYNYYHSMEIARTGISQEELNKLQLLVTLNPEHLEGGLHMCVGKSRRKGYSFKNGSITANAYTNVRGSLSIIGAFDKKYLYPNGTMGMSSAYLNFLNSIDGGKSGFARRRDYVDKQDHRKASFKRAEVENGTLSQIMALTFKDNPDAARGKDAYYMLFEEGGKFPNLKEALSATAPALEAGDYTTGQIIIFGTGGDMEVGSVGFSEIFYDPISNKILPFVNIWDDDAEATFCSFYHPVSWNMEGYYDEQGNSDVKGATEREVNERKKIIENSSDPGTYRRRIQEFSLKPSESFLTVSSNDFPVHELNMQLNKVKRENLQSILGQNVIIYEDEGEVKIEPDLKGALNPVIHYKPKVDSLTGCPIIYEPYRPGQQYIMGYDPYRQDTSTTTSLGACYVYKCTSNNPSLFDYTGEQLVAEYVGRPSTAEEMDRMTFLLAKYYHCYETLMFENEVTHVVSNAEKYNCLEYLASQPDSVISQNIKSSGVGRVYGIHMNTKLKDAGAKYIKQWLLTVRNVDENGNKILNLHTISSIGLLEELIRYNLKGNFDRVMAFMMLMFQLKEVELLGNNQHHTNNMQEIGKELDNLMALSQRRTGL